MQAKLLFITTFFCILIYSSFGIEYERSIIWYENKKNDFGIEFSGCIYPDTISKLPYYYENFCFEQKMDFIIKDIKIDKNIKYFSHKYNNLFDSIFFEKKIYHSRNTYYLKILLLPFYFSNEENCFYKITDFKIEFIPSKLEKSQNLYNNYKNNSVLSKGKWYKVKVKKDGIYKISYSDLSSWGFKNFSNIQIYGNKGGMLPKKTDKPKIDDLNKIPVIVEKGSDEVFNSGDYILFYAQGANVWYYNSNTKYYHHHKHQFADYNCYFITESDEPTYEMFTVQQTEGNSSAPIISTFDDYDFVEPDDINLLHSGAEWFGDRFSNNLKRKYSFNFSNISTISKAILYYDFVSISQATSYFTIYTGNRTKSLIINKNSFSSYGEKSDTLNFYSNSSNISVDITFKSSSNIEVEGYLNYLGVNVVRNLKYSGNQLHFRNNVIYNSGKVSKYVIETDVKDAIILDITNVNSPNIIKYSTDKNSIFFFSNPDTIHQYIIFNKNGDVLSPIVDEQSGNIKNQDIHGSAIPDLIIVSPTDTGIYNQALRLAKFRESYDKLNVLLVTTDQIYNEFSSGVRDVSAIRNMVKYFYDRDVEHKKMKYLLLFGKGTFANHIDKTNNYNLIPTFESEESLISTLSYVTDDFFGWMDNNTNINTNDNLLSIGIGRLPVKNANEAKIVVDKLINYENPSYDGDWKNILCFVGDDEDGYIHTQEANMLANYVDNNYKFFNIQKIFFDAYVQTKTSIGDRYPDVNILFNNRVNNGALIINYMGHGSEVQLAHEVLVDVSIIRTWQNKYKLPFFVTGTCEFTRYDDVNLKDMKAITTAGEEVLLYSNGGAVGLFSTTRAVYPGENYELNLAFYKYIFEKDKDGNYYRLGDAVRLAKNDVLNTGVNRLNFSLFGDPSMTLAYPKENVITVDSINLKSSNAIDTISALSVVNIKGHYGGTNDTIGFYGKMYVTVFDKPDSITTLVNDPESSPYSFETRQSIIFKGLVDVKDGKFDFNFPVPKDIRYNYGFGKMIFYASDINSSYCGNYSSFFVGGINSNAEINIEGPIIKLYMNDTLFKNGGITDKNPKLLAILYDKDGINSTGSGIGHDISAVIDGDINKTIILNDYYRTFLNEYSYGYVEFPFTNLEAGKHSITITAYDIYNNPSEASIDFEVISDNNIAIKSVLNYPNPMKDYTTFVVEHNWAEKNVELELCIYNLSGNMITKMKYKGTLNGFNSHIFRWNRTTLDGKKAAEGIYIYNITLKGEDAEYAKSFGKLIIVH